jgi:hypothetical protein
MRQLLMVILALVILVGCAGGAPPIVLLVATATPVQAQIAAATPIASTRMPSADSTRPPSARPTQSAATPTIDPDLLLPDLQTLPPYDLVIRVVSATDRKLLRLSNSILNGGPGAIEMLGVFNPATGKTTVTQHIYKVDGTSLDYAAGEFVYHPGHQHWHLENFVSYEVWSLTRKGALDAVVAFSDKVSYCLQDDSRSDIPGSSRRTYTQCDRKVQGISVGWIDTYTWDTEGQIVDITDVPDDLYALRSTVDPANRLWEVDDTNNSATVYIEIVDNRVRIVDEASVLERLRVLDTE